MGNDIRIDVDFLLHHKTRRLKRKLGSDAVLALLSLFCYAGKFRSDGTFKGMDAEDISDASGWEGDASEFVSELCDIGFIEQCEEGIYSIHDWAEHNPWAAGADERKEIASRAGKASAEKRALSKKINASLTDFNGSQQAVENGSTCHSNGTPTPSPSPSPSPSPTPEEVKEKIQGAGAPARDHEPVEDSGKPGQREGEKQSHAEFKPPTVEEVQARIVEQCYLNADAAEFWNFYASKGWMVGKNPMKDWGAALAGWNARARSNGDGRGKFGKPSMDEQMDRIFAGCL